MDPAHQAAGSQHPLLVHQLYCSGQWRWEMGKKPRGGLGVVSRGVKLGEGGVGEGVKWGKRGQRV